MTYSCPALPLKSMGLLCLFIFLQANELAPKADAGELRLIENDDLIRVELRQQPVLEYVKKAKPVPVGIASVYQRSGYIHPVFSPSGRIVTGDYPRDHPHQHALFFAWTSTTWESRATDFWNLRKGEGRVEHRRVADKKIDEDQVAFTVELAFVAEVGEQTKDVLSETWTVTVHRTPPDYFLFDIESRQQTATKNPLLINQYHYGGMAFRGPDEWLTKNDSPDDQVTMRFLTSEGHGRESGNHTQARWVNLSGQLDGKPESITVMGSPRNFRAPQHVRLHPQKPYFCYSPMVTSEFSITADKPYVSRYRYLVMSKAVDADLLEKHWQEYVKQEAAELP